MSRRCSLSLSLGVQDLDRYRQRPGTLKVTLIPINLMSGVGITPWQVGGGEPANRMTMSMARREDWREFRVTSKPCNNTRWPARP